jgi:endoglucanase
VDLLALQPLADGNVIYNFHFYEPHEFTHQGANWGEAWWSYDAWNSLSAHGNLDAGAAEGGSRRGEPLCKLENYWLDHWDAHRIRLLIDEAAAWGMRISRAAHLQ